MNEETALEIHVENVMANLYHDFVMITTALALKTDEPMLDIHRRALSIWAITNNFSNPEAVLESAMRANEARNTRRLHNYGLKV